MNGSKNPERPGWWAANEQLRQEMELPPYNPPRFDDGVYTHEVIPDFEDRYDCVILFVGVDPRYPEDWYVRVDGTEIMSIGRHRDENGNTIYEMTSEEFAEQLDQRLRDRDC